jgi:hypothetical protein
MTAREGDGRRQAVLLLSSLVVLVAVPFDLIPMLRGPAPYPPEWQWAFRPEGPARPLVAAAAFALGLLALLVASGTAWAQRRPVAARRALVFGAVLLSCGLQLGLLVREPDGPLRTLLSRTRSRSFTSYHTVAISLEAHDPSSFLRHHAERLPELARSAKHAATHPPGPVLYYRTALALCEASPALTDGLLTAAGVPDREFRPPATRPARAAALLGALVLGFLGALTAWPIAHLARVLGVEGLAAARLAILWALLPGPALMTPQFDQALALPVAGATVLLLAAGVATRRGPVWAVLAGLLGGIAIFASYGAAAFLAIGGGAALAAAGNGRTGLGRPARLATLATAVAGLVAFVVPALLGHQPVRALLTALDIHREMYTAPRSYALWLVFNPVDLALFLGVPVAAAGFMLVPRVVRGAALDAAGVSLDRLRLAVFAGVGVLVALGVTRGEVGRIWIPLMPLLLVASLGGHDAPDRRVALLQGTLLAALTLTIGSYWIV